LPFKCNLQRYAAAGCGADLEATLDAADAADAKAEGAKAEVGLCTLESS
jgi:hypothetical protein